MSDERCGSDSPIAEVPTGCPLCGGDLVDVEIRTKTGGGGVRLITKFRNPAKLFARTSFVSSLACQACGHLLLFMDRPDIIR